MQVQSNYLSSSYAATTKLAKSDNQSADTESQGTANLEQMLENLRKDPTIDDRITENEDGSYSFSTESYSWSEKSFAARAIITELNGESFSLIGTEGMMFPSDSDAQLFKQLTGYNLFRLGDASVVLDDDGFPPAEADQSSVKQAFDFISDVMIFRNEGYFEGDLTSENVGAIMSAYNISPGSNSFVDQLLDVLSKSSEASSAPLEAIQQTQIDEILDLVSA
ncbi:hypothetical protein [Rhizobium sp. AG855]|uniref:hypothetical protein n=1 Tax=Rhizobium sp. AG855 TaxID=2183898 RepID=UPI000E7163A7|nr:hypothetical protein [Rhizobium sp. AG855]RKE85695.1 hypothetical protein DFO46_2496 [Rhizobium sp. AG855]